MSMDSEDIIDDLYRKKLAYSYERFNRDKQNQPRNLTKDFWSTLTQLYLFEDDKGRSQQLIDKYITTPQQLTMLYLKMIVLQLTEVF